MQWGRNNMNTVIIYASKYGTTKGYAQKLKDHFACDIYSVQQFKPEDFSKYDTIIYGGRLTAGHIKGLKLIKKNFEAIKQKNLYVFIRGSIKIRIRRKQKRSFRRTLPPRCGRRFPYHTSAVPMSISSYQPFTNV